MANDWIIDVLADLKVFASENGLLALASQLDDTILVAVAELTSLEDAKAETVGWEVERAGRINRTIAAR